MSCLPTPPQYTDKELRCPGAGFYRGVCRCPETICLLGEYDTRLFEPKLQIQLLLLTKI